MFGKKRPFQTDIISVNHGLNGMSKSSFEAEIVFMKQKLMDRSDWMQDNIAVFNGYKVTKRNNQHTRFILNLLPLMILVVITTAYWIYYALNRKRLGYRRLDL